METGERDWDQEITSRRNNNQYYKEQEIILIFNQLISGLCYLQKKK